jgi:molybdopterin-guanine dinucleotide biosynthesis protein A
MVIALIMGRKGSKGFAKKNTYNVLGKPLASYSMEAAKNCPDIDKVFLSTDDEELMKLSKGLGIEIIKRPPELCTDEALGEDVYVHGYNTAKKIYKDKTIELIVLLMCNVATVTPEAISKGIKKLKQSPEIDSAVSVSKYNMWSPVRARREGKDGLLYPFIPFEAYGDTKGINCDRDSQGDVWFADMGVSIVRPRCLENIKDGMLPQKWMGKKIYPLKQSAGLDVDYEWQIPQVEYWLKNKEKLQHEEK